MISRLDSVVPAGEHPTPDEPDIGNADNGPAKPSRVPDLPAVAAKYDYPPDLEEKAVELVLE